MGKIMLNDLLKIENLENVKVKFNQFNGNIDPMEEYKHHPDIVNTNWLLWRTDVRYFKLVKRQFVF